ncbi:MAG: hypothetical protein MZU97_10515 [Bacillus subtilis]|nr:hypothetical protein [Bacillus subtilis]
MMSSIVSCISVSSSESRPCILSMRRNGSGSVEGGQFDAEIAPVFFRDFLVSRFTECGKLRQTNPL